MKKTIELDQDFINKLLVEDLKDYRESLYKSVEDYFLSKERAPYLEEDLHHHLRMISALDVVISGYG